MLGIARISTEHQDTLSLEDQQALDRQWLAQHTGLPFALKMIAGRGSGECLDGAGGICKGGLGGPDGTGGEAMPIFCNCLAARQVPLLTGQKPPPFRTS